ncbi:MULTISPECIES: MFS transporter [unclassified Serratia (in: enterobacteria)]|uniref:MFS transporter n=1 Tax=unclassified Serratia (in: enterobacteria) TaxID=2647522 RepID=UPI001E2BDD50|nr:MULTISPECIES: MFS transporter [unclassified Serratia (in: enterobacteria)]
MADYNNTLDLAANPASNHTHQSPAHSASGREVTLLVVVALLVLTQLYLAIPLLTPVGQSFSSATPGSVTFALASCFSLAYAGGFLFWGPLSDQYGRRLIMLVGLSVLSVATLACVFAPSLPWLAGLRMLQGLAASSFAPAALAYLSEAVLPRHRAIAIGAMSTSFLVAGILGQVFAAWVALQWGWIWVFIATGTGLMAVFPFIVLLIQEPVRTAVDGHLGHRFIALGKIAMRPAIVLLSCAHITLLLSFVAMYTLLGPHLAGLNLDPDLVIALRLSGLPGMFMALLVGPLANRFGMPGVASVGYLVAAVGLTLEAILSQTIIGIGIGSLLFVTGVALAVPAMISRFGDLAAPDRAAGMALNGFVLFIGASIGPLIVSWVPDFVPLLAGLTVVLLLASICVMKSASLTSSPRKS